jgi:transcriptional regulator with XRE-family HTH domain
MKFPVAFQQIVQRAYERASMRYVQAGREPLSLRRIALETGIQVSVLSRMSRGISQPERNKLFHLLVYLGCDEEERQCIFHLAEMATPEEVEQASQRASQILPILQGPSIQAASSPRTLDLLEMEILSLQTPPEALPKKQQIHGNCQK